MTVLSREMGIISVCAYGVRSGKSKLKAATQVFCLGDFVLSKKVGEIYRVESCEIVESFYPLCEDFEKLALGGYFMELASDSYLDGDKQILSLLLNSLYVLAYRNASPELVKAVFELKLAQLSGYEPEVTSCSMCGEYGAEYFDFSGGILCSSCKSGEAVRISAGMLSAMRYILSADEKKLFSFEVSKEVEEGLCYICETYLTEKNEKKYKTLEYYKKIKRK